MTTEPQPNPAGHDHPAHAGAMVGTDQTAHDRGAETSNRPEQDPASDRPEQDAAADALPKMIRFEHLSRCGDEVWIENMGQIYRLRRTRQGKLILTK